MHIFNAVVIVFFFLGGKNTWKKTKNKFMLLIKIILKTNNREYIHMFIFKEKKQ